jgi:sec-independent protein translocase protein TatA
MLLPLAWVPGPLEWIAIVGVGLLIFGKRLPEVGRGLGKSIVEFKRGLKGIEDDVEDVSSAPPRRKIDEARTDKALNAPYASKAADQSSTVPPDDQT